MRHAGPLGRRGLRRADVHPSVDEHRVDAHDLGAEPQGQADRRLGLPGGGGADEGERPLPGGHAAQAGTASGARTSSPVRWCVAVATILTCANVPGSSGVGQVHDPVRPRARLRRHALLVAALHQDLDLGPELGGRPRRADALLERHEPLEPLLHDLLRDLLVERGRPRAGPRRVLEHERAVEVRLLDDLEGLCEVVLGLPGEAHDDVGRHRDVGDRLADPRRATPGSAPAGTNGASPSARGRSPTGAGSGCARRPSASRPSPRSRRA